jgi:hypothetical protein
MLQELLLYVAAPIGAAIVIRQLYVWNQQRLKSQSDVQQKKLTENKPNSFWENFDKEDANKKFNTALKHLDESEPIEALTCLDEAIRFHDKEPLYYHQRGIVHFLLQNYGAAESDFNQAKQTNGGGSELFNPKLQENNSYYLELLREISEEKFIKPNLIQSIKDNLKNLEFVKEKNCIALIEATKDKSGIVGYLFDLPKEEQNIDGYVHPGTCISSETAFPQLFYHSRLQTGVIACPALFNKLFSTPHSHNHIVEAALVTRLAVESTKQIKAVIIAIEYADIVKPTAIGFPKVLKEINHYLTLSGQLNQSVIFVILNRPFETNIKDFRTILHEKKQTLENDCKNKNDIKFQTNNFDTLKIHRDEYQQLLQSLVLINLMINSKIIIAETWRDTAKQIEVTLKTLKPIDKSFFKNVLDPKTEAIFKYDIVMEIAATGVRLLSQYKFYLECQQYFYTLLNDLTSDLEFYQTTHDVSLIKTRLEKHKNNIAAKLKILQEQLTFLKKHEQQFNMSLIQDIFIRGKNKIVYMGDPFDSYEINPNHQGTYSNPKISPDKRRFELEFIPYTNYAEIDVHFKINRKNKIETLHQIAQCRAEIKDLELQVLTLQKYQNVLNTLSANQTLSDASFQKACEEYALKAKNDAQTSLANIIKLTSGLVDEIYSETPQMVMLLKIKPHISFQSSILDQFCTLFNYYLRATSSNLLKQFIPSEISSMSDQKKQNNSIVNVDNKSAENNHKKKSKSKSPH